MSLTPHRRLPFFSDTEVSRHNVEEDCWVSFFGKVYDLTPLVKEHKGRPGNLTGPIVRLAGEDISYWFDPKTQDPKTHIDEKTNLPMAYCPLGRFVHVPPPEPVADWSTDIGTPWWKDTKYLIGNLSKQKRRIRIVNTLTSEDHVLEVCMEDTLCDIERRFQKINAHSVGYVWKRLGRPLNMEKTLEENGIEDESKEFERLGLPPDAYTPAIHLHFKDDLTVA